MAFISTVKNIFGGPANLVTKAVAEIVTSAIGGELGRAVTRVVGETATEAVKEGIKPQPFDNILEMVRKFLNDEEQELFWERFRKIVGKNEDDRVEKLLLKILLNRSEEVQEATLKWLVWLPDDKFNYAIRLVEQRRLQDVERVVKKAWPPVKVILEKIDNGIAQTATALQPVPETLNNANDNLRQTLDRIKDWAARGNPREREERARNRNRGGWTL
ncbi:hypothetical protein HYT01_03670 [Candidatus Giovannonibacteria bacterium]|nr:hypothetical protein [Candidatus Giovannonibacteria bacterium]